jgi:rhodanese-related sulfurtransferase
MAGSAVANEAEGGGTISREELQERLSDPRLVIVDVLARAAYDDAHIPGSISIPLAEIPERARAVLRDPRQEITVYCASPT